MRILGVSGGFRQGYQDASACLVEDGTVIFAQEEERFSRVKFSPGRLPFLALSDILKGMNLSMQEIDFLAFHGSTWGNDFEVKLKHYFEQHFGFCPSIKRFHHHDCHAASSYFASGFEEALIFTSDSSGDGISFQVSLGKGKNIEMLKRFNRPNSIGIFYSMITQYCGFIKEQDEYKLMGLSSYGNRAAFDFSEFIYFQEDELILNPRFLISMEANQASPHKDDMLFNNEFVNRMGENRRLPNQDITQFYKDIAASAQAHIEKLMLQIVSYFCQNYQINNVCLAGGVALNCVLNQHLMNASFVTNLFVQPASGDAGISIGAAWLAGLECNVTPEIPNNYYLGNQNALFVRIQYSYKDYLKLGFVGEKDAGEPFLPKSDTLRKGFDFYSAHLFLKDAQRETFHDGGFSDTGLTDQNRIVFFAAT
jgi:carbamoyltransferase